MSERLFGHPEVRLIENDITEEWMEEFNDDFAARLEENEENNHAILRATHTATVSVVHWFEQPHLYATSSHFEINDQLDPDGEWFSRIQGKIYKVNTTYMPEGVGGNKEPVLALYDAGVVEQDGTINPIGANGLTVLVRLKDVKDAEIEVEPIVDGAT